jgi:hypothetical protein
VQKEVAHLLSISSYTSTFTTKSSETSTSQHARVVQHSCILHRDGCLPCNLECHLGSPPTNIISLLSQTNMPATTVEEWLDSEQADEPPHRCKKIVREWITEDGAFVTCRADDGTQQTHKLVAMSSLSRRACYKCGNVGHYAEVCSSAERLCYNCEYSSSEVVMRGTELTTSL